MMGRIRSLERQLACQRAQVLSQRVVEDYVEAFERALSEGIDTPDELDLVQAVVASGVLPLRLGPLLNHISQCRQRQQAPDIAFVVQLIVHGFAMGRPRSRQRCGCLARELLPTFPS